MGRNQGKIFGKNQGKSFRKKSTKTDFGKTRRRGNAAERHSAGIQYGG